jgi:ribosomal protein S12 methylthiotransferase accessory factor
MNHALAEPALVAPPPLAGPCDAAAAIPPQVRASLADRDRICPALAGTGWVEGDRLKLRLAQGDLQLRAPRRLLRWVFECCDGTTPWSDLVAAAPAREQEERSRFLEFLFSEGALVDAIHLTLAASGLAWQTTPMGLEAPAEVTDAIGLRLRPDRRGTMAGSTSVSPTQLDPLLQQRSTARTFGEQPLSARALECLLWTVGGVVSDRHPRASNALPQRTVPSAGGMYLIRWSLVLKDRVGDYEPGVYALSFPAPRQVALHRTSTDVQLLYRSLLRPWQLRFACGLLVAHADARIAALRYRNRALQYLFTEAGAGFQNLGLAAPGLGLGAAVIGGYCEETVSQLCGLGQQVILGTALFGAAASVTEQAALERMPPIDFVWSDARSDAYPLPFFIARARVKGETASKYNTWGKDPDPWLAYVKAHAETIERQGPREPRNVIVAAHRHLERAVAPDQICAYAGQQYRSPTFPFSRFDPTLPMHWLRGQDVVSGETVHVPADFICKREHLPPLAGATAPTLANNSSGLAAGTSLDDALQRALHEVIERDAFMSHWLTQRPGQRVPVRLLPAEIARRVAALQAAGCETVVQSLDAAAGAVCLVSASHPVRHFTCVAASGRFDFAEAARGALDELETMVYTRLVGQHFQPLRPRDVDTPEDHTLLYAQQRYFRAADAVLRAPEQVVRLPPAPGQQGLACLVDQLATRGLRPLFVDVTPAQNCIEDGRTPLTVVKAIVPSLIPISFGYGREPRAMVTACDPRAFIPHPFP